jgi:hypothetical protein
MILQLYTPIYIEIPGKHPSARLFDLFHVNGF